jgi:general secretion pathway protein M
LILSDLKPREKIVIAIGATGIVLFLFFQLIAFPLLDEKKRLQKNWRHKKNTAIEIRALKVEFDRLNQKQQQAQKRFGRRDKQFSLFAFVEQTAGGAGLKDHIAYMKPSTVKSSEGGFSISSVEMKLQDITLKQLVTYLHKIEISPNMVRVHRMAINKTGKLKDHLTVTMQVQTITS